MKKGELMACRVSVGGFSLIELLISMAVGYFLITVLFTALWVIYNRMASVRAYNSVYATLSVAHDMMARDLKSTPCERSLFKKFARDGLIWPVNNNTDRCYELAGATLTRIEGRYDAKTNQWHNAVRSVVLNDVSRCQFEIENSSALLGSIKISLAINGKRGEISETLIVATRNRQIG